MNLSSAYLSSELILIDTQTIHRPGVLQLAYLGCLLAYLANVYRLLSETDSSKQQGLKHWQYHLVGTAGVRSRQV